MRGYINSWWPDMLHVPFDPSFSLHIKQNPRTRMHLLDLVQSFSLLILPCMSCLLFLPCMLPAKSYCVHPKSGIWHAIYILCSLITTSLYSIVIYLDLLMLSYYVVYILAERTSLNWFTCTVESENFVTYFNVSFLTQVEVLNFFFGGGGIKLKFWI